MDNPVIIFGAKNLGTVALEIFHSHKIDVYCFLDDDTNLHGKEVSGITVLGSTDDDGFLKLIGKKIEAFIATDDNKLRKKLVEMLNERRKVMPTNATHKEAFLSSNLEMGHGNLIDAKAILNSGVKIGHHNIIRSGAILDYNVKIDDFVQIGAGAIIGDNVEIEEGAFIGAGATIVSGVKIGKNARVGAGSVVIGSVAKNETVFGNPAQKVKA
ncbi:MAG: acetyltransferase [Raineya sp.]|jgi:sugar O-acyltransferase (sialic acid O-acetyltransferase NeuD family)|nr:acetyltransferase [Raineya sp.]